MVEIDGAVVDIGSLKRTAKEAKRKLAEESGARASAEVCSYCLSINLVPIHKLVSLHYPHFFWDMRSVAQPRSGLFMLKRVACCWLLLLFCAERYGTPAIWTSACITVLQVQAAAAEAKAEAAKLQADLDASVKLNLTLREEVGKLKEEKSVAEAAAAKVQTKLDAIINAMK